MFKISELENFIIKHRKRFEAKHNNMFSYSINGVVINLKQLQIINERAAFVSKKHHQINLEMGLMIKKFGPGPRNVTKEEMLLMKASEENSINLQLEIESYYLFAKQLLDKIARALEFYFGSVRKHPLDSHDDLTKHFEYICKYKGLILDTKFSLLIHQFKKDIADFRDYAITHEKSPRTLRYFQVNDKGQSKIALNSIYPKESDIYRESRYIEELNNEIDEYIHLMMDFIITNQDKTNLELINDTQN